MKNRPTKIILLCVLVSLLTAAALSQEGDLDFYFNRGLQKYLRADYKGAIEDLERARKIDASNEKVIKFLVKALVDLGAGYSNENNFSLAMPYVKRAFELAPGDPGVRNVYVKVENMLKTQAEKGRADSEEKKRQEELDEQKKKERERTSLEENARRARELAEQRDRREREEKIKGDELIKIAQEQWRIEAREQLKREETREADRKRFWKIITVFISVLIAAGIAGIIFVIIRLFNRNIITETASTRQEGDRLLQLSKQQNLEINEKVNKFGSGIKDILTNQMERIIKMMEEQSRAGAQETIKLEVKKPDGSIQVLTDINPHVRARANGVELIEQTIDDRETGEKLLEPFLNDVDSRVRANAAKGMYKYNREKAMVVIDGMCRSSDNWMRLSGAWALGEIGNDIAIKTLMVLLEDPKDIVVSRAVKSLEKILENKQEELDGELSNTIKRRIKDARTQRKLKT